MIAASVVDQVRRLLGDGKLSHRKIAAVAGISPATVYAIARGRRLRSVGKPRAAGLPTSQHRPRQEVRAVRQPPEAGRPKSNVVCELLNGMVKGMIAKEISTGNGKRIAQAECTLREMLAEVLGADFDGTVLLQLAVQDGTIQHVRSSVERLEAAQDAGQRPSAAGQQQARTNNGRVGQVKTALQGVFEKVLHRGFFGAASVELLIDAGTIRQVRRRVERMEK